MGRNMYQQAIDAQSACNLSGLCHSMAKVADEVWAELRGPEGFSMDTKAFNEHPVIRLYAEQFMYLSSNRAWREAFEICEEKAKETT